MKITSLAAVALLGTSLCGCASIIKGSSEEVAVNTPSVAAATCTLSNTRGQWTVTTPGTVEVKRRKKDVQVHCAKEGYQEASKVVPSDFEPWTLGNLLLGGVIGVGVDASTGAINKYPSEVTVQMQPSVTGSAEPAQGPAAAPVKSSAAPAS
jgi:hypothetical protein